MQPINIGELKPHPRNNEFFDDITGSNWEQFLDSMRERIKNGKTGNVEPIVITQDKTIVSGHQRVRGLKELGEKQINAEIKIYDSDDEILADLIETNIRQRGIGNPNAIKLGKCIKELERIYDIKQGGSGYYGNQYEESSNNYKTPKTEADIAKEIGISVQSLQNYKKLTEMIPELKDLVDTGIVMPTTALAIMRNLSEDEQIELISSMDTTKKITKNEVQKYINEINQLKSQSAKEKIIDKTDYDLENKYKKAMSQISNLKTKINNLEIMNSTLKSSNESNESLLQSYKKESEEYIKLKNDIATLNLDPSGDYNVIEISKDITTLVNEIEKLLSTTLSPLRYSKILPVIKDNTALRKNLENIIYMVNDWCETMAETIGVTTNKNIIDMEELN